MTEAVESVTPGEGLADPGVDGKGLQLTRPEEEDAVGDFFADSGQLEEPLLCFSVGQGRGFLQPARALGEEPGGREDVAGPKAKEAVFEGVAAETGDFGEGRQPVHAGQDLRSRSQGQKGAHLPDLDDSFGRAAEKPEEGFLDRLAQDAKTGEGSDRPPEVGIRTPGQCVDQMAPIQADSKLTGGFVTGSVAVEGGRQTEVEPAVRIEADPNDQVVEKAFPAVVGPALPTEGLSSVQCFGE